MSAMINQNLFSVLEDEHEEILTLLDETEMAGIEDRQGLLSSLEQKIISHTRAEESTLYSLLRERADEEGDEGTAEIMDDSFEDHQEMDRLLEELKQTDLDDDLWMNCVIQLKECFETHVEDEEDEVFPQARFLLSRTELNSLLYEYREKKAELSEEWGPFALPKAKTA